MIKKIPLEKLKVGMYVHELDCRWMDHPFVANRFAIRNEGQISKIRAAGISELYIDTARGGDLESAPSVEQVEQAMQEEVERAASAAPPPLAPRVSTATEEVCARQLFSEATSVIRNLMEDVRLGKAVEVEALDPLAERMVQSVFRNHHALTGISRIKSKDEYTFMHCVSVAGLMITFARSQGFDEARIRQVAIGSLLHDIGKTLIPDEVLNKPGRLTPEEFEIMKQHVTHSGEILQETLDLSQTALDVAMLHHERMDGTGYPLGLDGEAISQVGQMSAIVDVYDALTSVRVYKDAWEPTHTLKKMLEWSPGHFSRELVQHFIRCLGIYPVGSLVELESGRLGIVLEQGEDMLRPQLRIIYSAKKRCYLKVEDIDLAREKSDRILSAVVPSRYGIDLGAFL
ncbi:HD-GYP domain-containing protein [Thiohalobacter sp. IOR34]|uniref:HD-GYP domain-containing protein n=1 Tax=Thiohalobacter sp. IOR34 TaxID=3057176 RepID=UPI0025B13BD4|nr:HD-GYP domain-containing protein [Thiohalobacter sp. IOR34]WJW75399.1 HD-GYP domain-containing protein [Thiohalobacter sp. IOR34]